MMNHSSKKLECNVTAGTIINGKWHNKSYKIMKPLGFGATGEVYLAEYRSNLYALKLSANSMSIASEVNVLRRLAKVQGAVSGPFLLDVDDWVYQNKSIPFYVMEYVKGEELFQFIKKRGIEWLGILMAQLLNELSILHKEGFVFGDLKPENLLVSGDIPKIRWLDPGGVTQKGRSIKEFTEFYDRGYWGLGNRRAENSYDLFSIAMIMINVAYPNRFSKRTEKPYEEVFNALHKSSSLEKYKKIILKALQGEYDDASQMRKDLLKSMGDVKPKPSQIRIDNKSQKSNISSQMQSSIQVKPIQKSRNKKKGVLETLLIGTIMFVAYLFYFYGQLY